MKSEQTSREHEHTHTLPHFGAHGQGFRITADVYILRFVILVSSRSSHTVAVISHRSESIDFTIVKSIRVFCAQSLI